MQDMRRKDKKDWIKDMAAQRIVRLFGLAADEFSQNPDLSKRYVFLARKISMRHRVRLPKEFKRRMCKNCGAFLVTGANCRVRSDHCRVVVTCLECGKQVRSPY